MTQVVSHDEYLTLQRKKESELNNPETNASKTKENDMEIDTAQKVDLKEEKETWMVCKENGKRVEWTEEVNYKFKLTAFKDDIRKWLTDACSPQG